MGVRTSLGGSSSREKGCSVRLGTSRCALGSAGTRGHHSGRSHVLEASGGRGQSGNRMRRSHISRSAFKNIGTLKLSREVT